MNQPSRHEAQQRADQIRVFQRELAQLESEGVLALSAEQGRRVDEHHRQLLGQYAQSFDIDRDQRASQMSLGMRIASLFGALALSASVFFLFYQFWGWLATGVQVTILIAAPLLMLGVTLLIQRRDSSGYFAKLAALVTFACFVLNISMLGQIFNITPSDKALLPWAALAFLLAYACDLRLLLVAGILCLIAYVSARTGTWGGMYWLSFGQRPENFFPAALLLLVVPQFVPHRRFADFPPMYRIFGLLAFFLPVLVMGNWGYSSYLDWDVDLVEGFYQVVGFVTSALAVWLGVRRQWPEVINTGVTFFIIFLYTKIFDWWWEVMPKYLFFLVLGLVAVLFLVVLKRLRANDYKLLKGDAS
ncbi:MAG: DUF2157 domain-containing protein [Gammaproteobacteria bacterium]|nr:DUF2157 domain-containing protein [Gammaproteobacteria bacterium]MBU1777039.1 DUF2157 domain-containing protein [Gammaproteobacteria bacterium]MBU1969064.1 DUF2157 domain-containing protein [Gammaproteobacteria bacterium]